jgi:uncharacterized protein (DUF1800 family)
VAAQSGEPGSPAATQTVRTAMLASDPPGTPAASAVAQASTTKQISDPLKRAAHLLRRAGFGGSLAEIEAFAKLDRAEAVSRLVDYDAVSNAALDQRIANAGLVLNISDEGQRRGQVIQDMQRWWLLRMAYTARPLEERMTFIWHGLLTSQVTKIGPLRARWMVIQNETLRKHAMGRYDDLLQATSKDPAMMVYLDTIESTREHPNENYPRELMELFSMGEGNYTEEDVREASRAFTGWRVTVPPRPTEAELAGLSEQERQRLIQQRLYTYTPEFRFVARQHDSGQKTFLGRTGAWGGEDIVRIIMEQPITGRYITTRLWEELAYGDPEPGIVDRLVKTWDSSGHSVREVVRAILMSDEFYSERAYFGKVRSPIELVVGVVRGLEIDFLFQNASPDARGRAAGARYYATMDQVLFEPPNVAGWPGGERWLSSSTFFARVNFLDQVLFPRGRGLQIPALAGATSAAVLDAATARLVDGGVAGSSRDALIAHLDGIRDPAERAATAAYLVASSPQFQLI